MKRRIVKETLSSGKVIFRVQKRVFGFIWVNECRRHVMEYVTWWEELIFDMYDDAVKYCRNSLIVVKREVL